MKFIWYFTVALGLSAFGPTQGESVLSNRVLRTAGDGGSSLMHLPAIDGTAAGIVAFVLAAIKAGMDPAQIMGVLHSEGYTKEENWLASLKATMKKTKRSMRRFNHGPKTTIAA